MPTFGIFRNRAFLFLALASLATGPVARAQADREQLLSEQREQEETQRNAEAALAKIDAELAKLRSASRSNQTRLASAQLELRKAEEQVKLQQARVALTKRDVGRLSGEITVTAGTIRAGQRHLASRAKDLMKSSRLANLELLLKSGDAAEMELRERFLRIEADADVAMIRRTVEAKTELEEKKTEKETVLAELVTRERELDAARNQVIVKRNELQRVQNEIASATANKQEARNRTLAMLAQIRSKLASLKSVLDRLNGELPAPTRFARTVHGDVFRPDGVTIPGVYIMAAHGSPVKAMADGEVISIQNMHGMGQTVIVGHGGHLQSVYANLSSVTAPVGRRVKRGDEIGRSGTSPYGDATYFAVYASGVAQDPYRYLN